MTTDYMTTDYEKFLEWKAERDEEKRKSGDYWITPEGRDFIREIYTDYLDGNAVLPLLDALERAEKRIQQLQESCTGKRHDGCGYLAQCGTVCDKCGQLV